MPEETLQVLLPSVQVSGIDLRKRQLTPEWNDYLAASRTNWVKQNINNPNELFDPKKARTRINLTDSDWDYIYSQHPEYFDPAGKYHKQVPDKYLSRQFNQGIRNATSEAAPIILPWVMGFMNPFAVGAGITSLMAADEITNEASGGKYLNFTQFTTDKLGPVAGTIVGMTPGIIGGGAAAKATYAPSYTTNARIIERDPSLIKETILDVNKNIVNYKPKPTSTRYYTKDPAKYGGSVKYTLYNANGQPAGILRTTVPEKAGTKGTHIEMIASLNNNHGVSEDLYNIAVKDAIRAGHPGLESGQDLRMPEVTRAVTSKFPYKNRLVGTPEITINPKIGEYEFKQVVPGRLLVETTNKPLAIEAPEGHFILYLESIRPFDNPSLKFFERPSRLSIREKFGLPKGTKAYTPEENAAFRKLINDFATKYGYEPIGEEVVDPEILEKHARAMLKRHNTFFRGVNPITKESDPELWALLEKTLGKNFTEELMLKYMATHAPGGGSGELYISPYSLVAGLYGKTVEITRPFTLGPDRTKWFTEGDFPLIDNAGHRGMLYYDYFSGLTDPWNGGYYRVIGKPFSIDGWTKKFAATGFTPEQYIPGTTNVPSEITSRNLVMIPQKIHESIPTQVASKKITDTPWHWTTITERNGGTINYFKFFK